MDNYVIGEMQMKVGIITQARTGSTRLPNKIFKEINNISLLEYHLKNLNKSEIDVYVATTINPNDNEVEDYCKGNNINFFRGSEENVLDRFYECAFKHKLDIIIRVCSDAPLIDGQLLKEGLEYYIKNYQSNLYLTNGLERTFPYGMDYEIFSFEMLKEANQKASHKEHKEHVTVYFKQNESKNFKITILKNQYDWSNYRLTVDTFEDYELIKTLIKNFNANNLNCSQIINVLANNSQLIKINGAIQQKKLNLLSYNNYNCLVQQEFTNNNFSIVPIRYQDRIDIMNWRNEQIYHLRQLQPLTQEIQDNYFNTVIANLFEEEKPKQILFSYLENDVCIGYGGLVHIDWNNKNAEISFVMNTSLEKDFFVFHWSNYLQLIEQVAFKELQLHKIFIYAYNLRPKLYEAAESQQFYKEAILKEHILFDDKFIDVVIHSKINSVI